MGTLTQALALIVAALHGWFLVLEMFLWTKPLGLRVFRQSAEQARASQTLAANQGLYNGFLAAGILFGLWEGAPRTVAFFLWCVVAAGVYGAYTVSRKIFWVQAAPALLALGLGLLAGHR